MSEEPHIAIVDAHAHLFSPRFFQALASQSPRLPEENQLAALEELTGIHVPASVADVADRWVLEMDRHHVDRMVLMASIPGDEQSALEAHQRHPDRILPYAMFQPRASDATERLEEAAGAGLRGACLFPAMHHYSMDEPEVLAFVEAATRHSLLIFVHCGLLRLGLRDRLGLKSPFDLRFSDPLKICKAAQAHPETPFVIPHLGAGMFREALLLCRQCDNVYLDSSSSNSWVATQPGRPTLSEVLAQALDVVGPTRLLFGSDSSYFPRGFCREVLNTQLCIFRDLGISPEEESLLFAGNLLRVLGLQE